MDKYFAGHILRAKCLDGRERVLTWSRTRTRPGSEQLGDARGAPRDQLLGCQAPGCRRGLGGGYSPRLPRLIGALTDLMRCFPLLRYLNDGSVSLNFVWPNRGFTRTMRTRSSYCLGTKMQQTVCARGLGKGFPRMIPQGSPNPQP